ncbi:MAG: diguanylate cyclase [Aureliella sp.]
MKNSSLLRINFVIVALCVAALFFASLTGVLPDERRVKAADRARFCETVAAQLTFLVAGRQTQQVESLVQILCQRNPSLISVGIRKADGSLLVDSGKHQATWPNAFESNSDGCYMVPIRSTQGVWGNTEIQFAPLYAGWHRVIGIDLLKLLALVVPSVAISVWIYLRKTFQYLDPSRVVPGRVRQTLDSFVEGVLLLDRQGRIMLANEAFHRHIGQDKLLGVQIADLPWVIRETETGPVQLPWERFESQKEPLEGITTVLSSFLGYDAIFSVNTTPVFDDKQNYQGMMVAFADITSLEQKRAELASTLEELNQSKQEISGQNEDLRDQAMRDPLTGCINRRSFYDSFQQLWTSCEHGSAELNVLKVDLDSFQAINDSYGQSAGDEVLAATGELLRECISEEDIVCRYGGEEFAVLVPGCPLDAAAELAETVRAKLNELEFQDFQITASVGVTAYNLGASDPGDMLDQADKCLFMAKQSGRNLVVRYDALPEGFVIDDAKLSRVKLDDHDKAAIPFPAVSALLAALSFRDTQTGAHSTRVANYAAAIAQELMSPSDVYIVEIAGLLHDIGKIGVSDAILSKSGKLDEAEWIHMHRHDVIGVELIRKSFQHVSLTEIIEHHHAWYDGSHCLEPAVSGETIPLGARILTIADSFDDMVSDRPYRKGMPIQDALAELRRCAGTQLDPQLVEVFAKVIGSQDLTVDEEEAVRLPSEVVVSLGEQIERVIGAVDKGDKASFVALAEKIRTTAEQNGVAEVAEAAARAVKVGSQQDVELSRLAEESVELLKACRSIHSSVADSSTKSQPPEKAPVA